MSVVVPLGVFGRVHMGYLVAESNKLDEWRQFAKEGLGLHADQPRKDLIAFRVDDHQRRILVRQGPAEDVVALGWQLDDEETLDLVLARLKQRGAQLAQGSAAEASDRGVKFFWRTAGPKGMAIELYTTPVLAPGPLDMKCSGFVTGAAGLGHVAITTREPDAMRAFWQDVFDARLSDEIEDRIDGMQLDFSFLRLNERHHSIAIASTRGVRLNPLRTSIHHFNLQAASLDDVTQAYLRCKALGYEMANGIGQHPNDKELSFYVVTPSGFEVELGWNPIAVQEEGWQPQIYRGISLWGHRPENLTASKRLGRVAQGISSLFRSEYTVKGQRA